MPIVYVDVQHLPFFEVKNISFLSLLFLFFLLVDETLCLFPLYLNMWSVFCVLPNLCRMKS